MPNDNASELNGSKKARLSTTVEQFNYEKSFSQPSTSRASFGNRGNDIFQQTCSFTNFELKPNNKHAFTVKFFL